MTMDQAAASGCGACRSGEGLGFDIAMAFQPIVDIEANSIFAYEALVRGPMGEGAASVLGRVTDANRYAFDQRCRVVAIENAVRLGIIDSGARLSINFLPSAVYKPEACIRLTLATARAQHLPLDRLMFEFTEHGGGDPAHMLSVVSAYRRFGFTTALDDFGADHAGLGLLADFLPDIVKIDMHLIRGIDRDTRRLTIVRATVGLMRELGVAIVAEGLETAAEIETVRGLGISLMQGYAIARPGFDQLPVPATAEPAMA